MSQTYRLWGNVDRGEVELVRLPATEELAAENLAYNRTLMIESTEVNVSLVNYLKLGPHWAAGRAANGRVERWGEDALVHAARSRDGQVVKVVGVEVVGVVLLGEAQSVDSQGWRLKTLAVGPEKGLWTAAPTAGTVEAAVTAQVTETVSKAETVSASTATQTVGGWWWGEGDWWGSRWPS